MNASLRLILALALFGAAPIFAAKSTGKPSTPEPSVELRRLIDTTLTRLSNITNPNQEPIDRTKLIEAQADFTAKALTALPAQQPMYQAALKVVADLVGAVEEHEKAVADYHYSKSVHGKQDREDAKISNPTRGWDAGALARADNAKQKMENDASRKALLDKEKFMNNGAVATWTERVGQIHAAVEQSFTTELVAEKQLAMLTPPAPVPAPNPIPKPRQPSVGEQYSPVGAWRPDHGARRLTVKDDNTVTGGSHTEFTGTWKWTDQSKGAMTVNWADGVNMDLNFSADGRSLIGKSSRGLTLNYTRGD